MTPPRWEHHPRRNLAACVLSLVLGLLASGVIFWGWPEWIDIITGPLDIALIAWCYGNIRASRRYERYVKDQYKLLTGEDYRR